MSSDLVVRAADVTVVTERGDPIIEDVDLALHRGEVLGLAGESGSGKSTLARALLGYARPGTRIAGGSIEIAGTQIIGVEPRRQRAMRGRTIAYVAQDATKAMNPAIRIGDLIGEIRTVHALSNGPVDVAAIFDRVNLPTTRQFQRRFAHQLSGGQQQRLAIGLAVACDPQVIVLDEPTSGLDVVTQAKILDEVARICRQDDRAAIFVSHDLAAMASIAHRIAVMYAGRIVEDAATTQLLDQLAHPYTAGLIASVPSHRDPKVLIGMAGTAVGVTDRPAGCSFAPRCPLRNDPCQSAIPPLRDIGDGHLVRCIHAELVTPLPVTLRTTNEPQPVSEALLRVEGLRAVHGHGDHTVVAADDVTFEIRPGECLALVGESGSGKSTIARCVAGLHPPASGTITFSGTSLKPLAKHRPQRVRQQLQIVFQNPYDSLNPTRTVYDEIARPLSLFFGLNDAERQHAVEQLLDQVRLPSRTARRLPHELSGGERQRVAIARAMAARPQLLICDEVTSSLDVSVQAAVLEVLADVDLAMLFITHDLGVVASIADTMVVLERGVVRDAGPIDTVMHAPNDDYTRRLIAAVPDLPQAAATVTR